VRRNRSTRIVSSISVALARRERVAYPGASMANRRRAVIEIVRTSLNLSSAVRALRLVNVRRGAAGAGAPTGLQNQYGVVNQR
jgi:hypothetical protein